MQFSEFVAGYRGGTVRVHVERALAMHVCDKHPSLPNRFRAAHSLWKIVSFLLLIGGIISLFWVKWWVGIGITLLGILMAPAVQKSAAEFVLEHALEDESFCMQMLEAKVIKVELVNSKR